MISRTREEQAQDMADGMGIPFYLSKSGRITQNNEDGKSRRFEPRPEAQAQPGEVEEVKILKDALKNAPTE